MTHSLRLKVYLFTSKKVKNSNKVPGVGPGGAWAPLELIDALTLKLDSSQARELIFRGIVRTGS